MRSMYSDLQNNYWYKVDCRLKHRKFCRRDLTHLDATPSWNIWQKTINIAPRINVAPSYIFSRQFESFIHSQSKRKLKNVKKFFKKSKSINVAPFNKDVALGKNLKN